MDSDTLQFHAVLSQAATRTEAALASLLPREDTTLGAAMRYAVLSGGKRLRGFLALESAAIFRVPQGQALRTAAAVECLHAYSLVHDDLPCMDDDDLRRGKPTVHVTWDEFCTAMKNGSISDDDGDGDFATATHVSDVHVPSTTIWKKPEWATHVLWYNK
jgi:farnesyl diphosphate synthase